ncbi:MAG: PfkB family carbohydrate kinase [Actinomycetota bacterium]|nr:PfkB family carbohydrate kinase [Actinomycetota bacterium]
MSLPAGGEILVVGAINVDLVAAVAHLPGPGETVVGTDLGRYGGGKGANAAVAAAGAGAHVRLIGAVGADDLGEGAMAELRAVGIVVDDVAVIDGQSTGVALIVVDAEGDNQIAVAAGANHAIDASAVGRAIERAGGQAGCVIVSTEIHVSAVVAAVDTATRLGVPCVLNPAPVVPEVVDLLGFGPVLTPNVPECVALAAAVGHKPRPVGTTGRPGREEVEGAARSIAARSGAPVVVTLGAGGALVVNADGQVEMVAVSPVTVVDTTGAGDTFNGVLGARLGAGDGLMAAVRAATAAASLSVSFAGARRSPSAGHSSTGGDGHHRGGGHDQADHLAAPRSLAEDGLSE